MTARTSMTKTSAVSAARTQRSPAARNQAKRSSTPASAAQPFVAQMTSVASRPACCAAGARSAARRGRLAVMAQQFDRVAVLADIHGNLPALEAVLAEAEDAGAQAFVLLGDIALGPLPGPTLDLLAGLGDRAIWVHGNCERELVTVFDGGP